MDIIQSSLGQVNLRIKVDPLYLPNNYYDHIEDFSCSTYNQSQSQSLMCPSSIICHKVRIESNIDIRKLRTIYPINATPYNINRFGEIISAFMVTSAPLLTCITSTSTTVLLPYYQEYQRNLASLYFRKMRDISKCLNYSIICFDPNNPNSNNLYKRIITYQNNNV